MQPRLTEPDQEFWDWLVHQGHIGSVATIDKVADEIDRDNGNPPIFRGRPK